MSFKSFFATAFVACALFSATILAGLVPAMAQTAGVPAQGGVAPVVLDWEGVVANSKAMKSVQEQYIKFQSAIQGTIDKEEKALKKAEAELQRKRTLVGPEQFAEENRKFQERFVAMQRMVQESNAKLNQVRIEAIDKVQKALRDELTKVVKESGISVVFSLRQTHYVDPRMDISKIMLEKLDAALPTVKVTDPATLK